MKTILNIIVAVITVATYSYAGTLDSKVSIEITGSLDHLIFRRGSFTNDSFPFKMIVSDNQWQIMTFGNGDSYTETTYDGTNIFHFCKTNLMPLSESFALSPMAYRVVVEPGPIPSGGYSVEIPWLAYASSAIFKTDIADLPAPWLDPRNNLKAHVYESKIQASSRFPYLPESATFELTKERAEKATDSTWITREGYRHDRRFVRKIDKNWKPDEPNGFIAARYVVTAVTNINGLTFPTSFELAIYRPLSKRPVDTYSGTNMVVRKMPLKIIRPTTLDKPIYVKDFRFYDKELNISYLDYISENWISSTNSTDLQKIFRRKLENPNLSLDSLIIRQPQRKPIMIYVFFAIAFLFPLPIIIYHWKKRIRHD